MDLTQLEMFNAVAEAGSITQAAAKVHRVPSNLTTRLRQLETELGVDLFIRENQRLRLSPAAPLQCAFRPRWRNLTVVIPKFSFHFPPALPALCWEVCWREN